MALVHVIEDDDKLPALGFQEFMRVANAPLSIRLATPAGENNLSTGRDFTDAICIHHFFLTVPRARQHQIVETPIADPCQKFFSHPRTCRTG